VVGDGTTGRCGAVSGETCAAGEPGRSQSLHGTVAVVSREKCREQSCAEGREGGRWIGEFHREAERKQSAASVRRDYAKRRDARPGSAVSGNLAVERTHVGGAGQRRHRRQIANVFFAAQGLFTIIAARVLASQSRCGNHRLESRVRENRTHGSEGGDGESRSRPLSTFSSPGRVKARISP
jgi:hypothetical protein